MEKRIVIYGKSSCPYTNKAREIYRRKGVRVDYIDVMTTEVSLQEMLEFSEGKRLVPVIVEGEKVSIGFGGT